MTDKKMDLETERLILREWKSKDLEPFYRMSSNRMECYPNPLTKVECEKFFTKVKIYFRELG
nr:GNAT family N-acetyltransferase [Leptospira noguchii]